MGNPAIVSLLILTSLAVHAAAQDLAPKELGAVDFDRDLDAVLRKKPAKPVFLLFQEVPG